MKKNKRMAFLILVIIIVLIPYFLVKQPILVSYNFNFSLSPINTKEKTLKKHVKFLSKLNRTSRKGQEQVINYILDELIKSNIDKENIKIQEYKINNRTYKNIIVSLKPKFDIKEETEKNYIIGAHYDTYNELPGADDNASGIAGLLEISRILQSTNKLRKRNIDLVFYSTEEPPFFGTKNMGSYYHAKSIKDKIELVMIFDMIGYFSEDKESQNFPISFMKYLYPTKGNFIAIVSNFSNSFKTREVKKRFNSFVQKNKLIEVESISAPANVQGIDFSDHRNYWKFNIPAILITDTAFLRNKNYHTEHDTYDKLDYKKMKEVVDATIATVLSL